MKNYFDFIWAMTEKEIKARYKRAVFGFVWILLNPLLQMIVIGFVFSFFIKIENYFLFLFSGLLVWTFFSLSITKSTTSIVNERSLIKKAKFPIEAIPVSIILSNFFHMIISFVIFLIVLVIAKKTISQDVLLVIPAFLWILFFTIGLSLLLSSLTVRFRDINFIVQTILILWFYATPIFYNLSLIPKEFYPFFSLNPLTSVFEILHYSLLGQRLSDPWILFANLAISLFIMVLGVLVFRKERKYFIDWL